MNSPKDQDGLLSRWSRRKLESSVEPEEALDAPAEPEEADEERSAQLAANREAAEAVDLSTLNKDSDISVFMKEGVPELLKRQALAALWRSNPVFSNVDGLVDYDDDFGSPDLIMKTFQSAYQAGRGYLKEIAEEEESDIPDPELAAAETETDPASEDLPAEELSSEADESEVAHKEPEGKIGNEQPPQPEETETRVEPEEPEMPKVSLRHRLMIDESS